MQLWKRGKISLIFLIDIVNIIIKTLNDILHIFWSKLYRILRCEQTFPIEKQKDLL